MDELDRALVVKLKIASLGAVFRVPKFRVRKFRVRKFRVPLRKG